MNLLYGSVTNIREEKKNGKPKENSQQNDPFELDKGNRKMKVENDTDHWRYWLNMQSASQVRCHKPYVT